MQRRDFVTSAGPVGVAAVGGYGVYTSAYRDDFDVRDESGGEAPAEPRDGWILLGVTPFVQDVNVLEPFTRGKPSRPPRSRSLTKVPDGGS